MVCTDPTETEPPALAQAEARGLQTVSRPICFAVAGLRDRIVFAGGPLLHGKFAKLVIALLPNFHVGQRAERGLAGHPFMKAELLARELGITGQGLRQQVSRIRQELKLQFRTQTGANVEDDDVIQINRWEGYRLSPHLSWAPMLAEGEAVSTAAE
jgi:hypothetical protein